MVAVARPPRSSSPRLPLPSCLRSATRPPGEAPRSSVGGPQPPPAAVRGFALTKRSDPARAPFGEGWGGAGAEPSFRALVPSSIPSPHAWRSPGVLVRDDAGRARARPVEKRPRWAERGQSPVRASLSHAGSRKHPVPAEGPPWGERDATSPKAPSHPIPISEGKELAQRPSHVSK